MNSPGIQGTCRPSSPGPGILQIVSRSILNSLGLGTRSWAPSFLTYFALQTRSVWLRPLQAWLPGSSETIWRANTSTSCLAWSIRGSLWRFSHSTLHQIILSRRFYAFLRLEFYPSRPPGMLAAERYHAVLQT
ncbi:hypothetical protein NPIL_638171 [Nephila pilipes]|uniref:Uncharacterized protein n=1 Tax=Nephila pilipes TaxID=299642 RepID=A0A8X6PUI5_NEPPI|nr:hypothetical protein NPIL_638171 [Nephila pilipes]